MNNNIKSRPGKLPGITAFFSDERLPRIPSTLDSLKKELTKALHQIININERYVPSNYNEFIFNNLETIQKVIPEVIGSKVVGLQPPTRRHLPINLVHSSFITTSSFNHETDYLIALNNTLLFNDVSFSSEEFPTDPETLLTLIRESEQDPSWEFSRWNRLFRNNDTVTITFVTENPETGKKSIQREIKPFYWMLERSNFVPHLENLINNQDLLLSFSKTLDPNILNFSPAWDNLINNFIGQSTAKNHAQSLVARAELGKQRIAVGLKDQGFKLNALFVGAPGTGKTSFAKALGKILKEKSLLSEGGFFLATKSDLVGEYVGHTENKVKNLVAKAKGSILFIDEAYNLVPKQDDLKDFGYNALQTLMEEIDKLNNDIMVIFAGYEDEIERVLNVNDGYRRRFPHVIKFEDYSSDELMQILGVHSENYNLKFNDSQIVICQKIIEQNMKEENFGNGGFITNFLEKVSLNRDLRLYQSKSIKDLTVTDLTNVSDEDINYPKTIYSKKVNKVISLV